MLRFNFLIFILLISFFTPFGNTFGQSTCTYTVIGLPASGGGVRQTRTFTADKSRLVYDFRNNVLYMEEDAILKSYLNFGRKDLVVPGTYTVSGTLRDTEDYHWSFSSSTVVYSDVDTIKNSFSATVDLNWANGAHVVGTLKYAAPEVDLIVKYNGKEVQENDTLLVFDDSLYQLSAVALLKDPSFEYFKQKIVYTELELNYDPSFSGTIAHPSLKYDDTTSVNLNF